MRSASFDIDYIRPEHKVCELNVEVPTIIVEPFNERGELEIFVQWFAEFSAMDFLKQKFGDAVVEKFHRMQFRFPVPLSLDSMYWMGHPERFKVILLGQVQDWPNKAAIPEMGKCDSWILWVTSSHYGEETQSGDGPACFVIPLKVVLADQLCGIITPKKYCDTTVLDREKQTYRLQARAYL